MSDLLELLRAEILCTDPRISEGIKWNSLSFRTTEWFATWNWRAKDRIELVFHLGAKPKPGSDLPRQLGNTSLVDWKSVDRGLISFSSVDEFKGKQAEFRSVVTAWVQHID